MLSLGPRKEKTGIYLSQIPLKDTSSFQLIQLKNQQLTVIPKRDPTAQRSYTKSQLAAPILLLWRNQWAGSAYYSRQLPRLAALIPK